MANFPYTRALQDIGRGLADFREAGADMRIILVMTDTTADIDQDQTTMAGFATLDEFDGSNYSTGVGVQLGSQVFAENTGANRAEFDAANVTFSSVGAGSRSIQAAVVFRFSSTFGASIPYFFIDSGFGPTPANGGNIVIAWNAEGIAQIT